MGFFVDFADREDEQKSKTFADNSKKSRLYAGSKYGVNETKWWGYIQHERAIGEGFELFYSFGAGTSFLSMASATLRRWILPVAVLGISGRIQIYGDVS